MSIQEMFNILSAIPHTFVAKNNYGEIDYVELTDGNNAIAYSYGLVIMFFHGIAEGGKYNYCSQKCFTDLSDAAIIELFKGWF